MRLGRIRPRCRRLHVRGDRVVLEFLLSPDGGGYWHEEDDWLDRLVTVRADLAQGDLRARHSTKRSLLSKLTEAGR